MANLWIDLETMPSTDYATRTAIRKGLSAPSNYKDQEKIDAYVNAAEETALDKTALDGLYGELIAVAWGWDEVETAVLVRTIDEKEDHFLNLVMTAIKAAFPLTKPDGRLPATWSGWNVLFDARFLWKRCIKHGIIAPFMWPHTSSRYPVVNDAMELWAGRSGDKKSLGAVGQEILGVTKGDSSRLWTAWLAEDYQKVELHAKLDLDMTRDLWDRMQDA